MLEIENTIVKTVDGRSSSHNNALMFLVPAFNQRTRRLPVSFSSSSRCEQRSYFRFEVDNFIGKWLRGSVRDCSWMRLLDGVIFNRIVQ